VFVALVSTNTAAAQARRFEALTSQFVVFAPTDFHEAKGSVASDVSGRLGDVFSTTALQIPQIVDDNDAFVWAIQHSYDSYSFQELRRLRDAEGSGRGGEAALGESPKAPFETLQILRGLWTWQHAFSSGYNFYLHHRSGLHGDRLRLNGRWLRVGTAVALERQWNPNHAFGAGVVVLYGIGGSQQIPFVRYGYRAPGVRISALLPLWTRVYVPLGPNTEFGVVLEADGNRYRLATPGLPFDNVDLVYSYWGPSFRQHLGHDVFFRADVGLSGLRVIDIYLDERLQTSLDMGRTNVFSMALSWEPTY
jgi:hypothetical protein